MVNRKSVTAPLTKKRDREAQEKKNSPEKGTARRRWEAVGSEERRLGFPIGDLAKKKRERREPLLIPVTCTGFGELPPAPSKLYHLTKIPP